MTAAQQRQARRAARAGRKPLDKSVCTVRFSLAPLLAKAGVLFFFCLLSVLLCASATRVTQVPVLSAALSTQQPPLDLRSVAPEQIPLHAQQVLQQQLCLANPSRFGMTAEEAGMTSWYQPGPDVLTSLSPDGIAEEPHDAAWSIHETGKWILGNHPEATPEQMQQMVDMLESNKAAFAYSLN